MENRTNRILIVGFIVAIIGVSITVAIFLTGCVVLPEFFPDSSNSQTAPSATAITPTPTQPPKPSPIELPIGTTVLGSITNTTTLNRYEFVVPQADTIEISMTRHDVFGITYVSIAFFDSAGVLIGGNDRQYLGTHIVPIGQIWFLELEAGTYFIEIASVDDYTGDYWLVLDWYD